MSDHDAHELSPPFHLSALLAGHKDDVRSLVACGSISVPCLFSASRDGAARSWTRRATATAVDPDHAGGWRQERAFEGGHEGFVNSVAWMAPVPTGTEDPEESPAADGGFLFTGGLDGLIQVYELPAVPASASASPDPEPIPTHTLFGHAGNVCALHSAGRRIVSGSWDMTARIWSPSTTEAWTCTNVLAHRAAVWDVLALETPGYEDSVLTACADTFIRLFKGLGTESKVLFKGHTEAVRALAKVLPEDPLSNLFASAGNDCTIRIWNLTGDAITILEGHSSFIYALVSLDASCGGGLASAGEDGIVRIWNPEDGELDQEILVPALSVWALACLPGGDLAIGCSDNLIWTFTRNKARVADERTIEDYETRLSARPAKQTSASTSKAPELPIDTADALTRPGSKDGDIKLVKKDGVVHAHQWTEDEWVDLGEVLDKPESDISPVPRSKMVHSDGKEYDFVFSIDVKDDEPPLKLAYNLSDDVHEVAAVFVAENALPESYLQQIVDFIRHSAAS